MCSENHPDAPLKTSLLSLVWDLSRDENEGDVVQEVLRQLDEKEAELTGNFRGYPAETFHS
jgi:hypothetical protein